MRSLLITLLILVIASLAKAQISVLPEGCVEQVNIPVQYKQEFEHVHIPAVSYQIPVMQEVTETICIKEAALEEYYECDENGRLKQCSREIPAQYETISYRVPTGKFETIIIQEGASKSITIERKVRDGYVAVVPCKQREKE